MNDDRRSDDQPLRRKLAALSVTTTASIDVARRDVMRRITRRRARRTVGLSGLAVVSLVGALTVASRLGDSSRAVHAPAPPTTESDDVDPVGELRLLAIEARGGPRGTERVILEFSGPLPEQDPAEYTPDRWADPNGRVMFTTQGVGSGTLQICGDWHESVGVKTVDILIPSEWLDPMRSRDEPVIRPDPDGPEGHFDRVAKIIPCWSTAGFVQVVVIGPASWDPDAISVEVVGNRIVLDATGD